MRTGAFTAILVTLAGLTAREVASQWYIGVELTPAHYGGSARDTSGNPHARPGDAVSVGLRVDRRMGQMGATLRLSYGKPGLSLSGEGLTITDKTAGQLLECVGLMSFRVGGIGPSGAIRAELGPALHLWKVGDEIRTRVGVLTAMAYEWTIVGKLSGALRTEGTLSKSWFDATDLPSEYRRQATWRYGVGLGLHYRL